MAVGPTSTLRGLVAVLALAQGAAFTPTAVTRSCGANIRLWQQRSPRTQCKLPDLGEGLYSLPNTRGLETLTPEQQKAFLDAVDDSGLVDLTKNGERVRASQPALADLSDEALADVVKAYVSTPTSLQDVLLKTPVGPVVLVNLVAAICGVSVCDLPFWPETTACLEVAARKAAGG